MAAALQALCQPPIKLAAARHAASCPASIPAASTRPSNPCIRVLVGTLMPPE